MAVTNSGKTPRGTAGRQADQNSMADAMSSAMERGPSRARETEDRAPRVRSWSKLGGERPPISATPNAEVLDRIQRELNETYQSTNDLLKLELFPLDSAADGISISALIVAGQSQEVPDTVAYHILILEGSVEPLPNRQFSNRGEQIVIRSLASEYYQKDLVLLAEERLRNKYPKAELFCAEANVLPRDIKLDDPVQQKQIAANAALACFFKLNELSPRYIPHNIADFDPKEVLTCTVDFDHKEIFDANSNPILSTVNISLTSQPVRHNDRYQDRDTTLQLNNPVTQITQLSAYMDLLWDQHDNVDRNRYISNNRGNRRPEETRVYSPVLVVTDMRSSQLMNTEGQLLALGTAMTMQSTGNWAGAFAPRRDVALGKNDIDLTDIGAVGIEAGLDAPEGSDYGRHVMTDSVNFGPADLGDLLDATMHPNLFLGIDLPDCGPQTWYTADLAWAARGDRDAIKRVFDAANNLTDGEFDKIFSARRGEQVIAQSTPKRILLGHCSKDGQKRDRRIANYLAVCNMFGASKPEMMMKYSRAMQEEAQTVEEEFVNLQRMAEIDEAVFGTKVTYTGYGIRFLFNPDFVEALVEGMAAAGLRMSTTYPDARYAYDGRSSISSGGARPLSGSTASLFTRGRTSTDRQRDAYQYSRFSR